MILGYNLLAFYLVIKLHEQFLLNNSHLMSLILETKKDFEGTVSKEKVENGSILTTES